MARHLLCWDCWCGGLDGNEEPGGVLRVSEQPSVHVVCRLLICLTVAGTSALGAQEPPAQLKAAEIELVLFKRHNAIRSWRIEYESVADPSRHQVAYPLHKVVAARSPDRFLEWTRKVTPRTHDWTEDPIQQRLFVNPSSVVLEFPASRSFARLPLASDAQLPGTYPQELLFAALGWWPFDERPAPTLVGGGPVVLRDIARSKEYRVRPTQERVDDRWCHVLEHPDGDRIWIDVDNGGAFVARELADASGGVLQRIELHGNHEVWPEIWVPLEIRNIVFDSYGPVNGRRVLVDGTFRIVSASVNDPLPDSVFEFKPLPGCLEIVGRNRFEQREPGGVDLLDEQAAWLSRHSGVAPTRHFWEHVEQVAELVVVVACGAVLFVGRRAERKARG